MKQQQNIIYANVYRNTINDGDSPDFFWGRGDVCTQAKVTIVWSILGYMLSEQQTYNRRQNELRLRPKLGFFTIYWLQKEEI